MSLPPHFVLDLHLLHILFFWECPGLHFLSILTPLSLIQVSVVWTPKFMSPAPDQISHKFQPPGPNYMFKISPGMSQRPVPLSMSQTDAHTGNSSYSFSLPGGDLSFSQAWTPGSSTLPFFYISNPKYQHMLLTIFSKYSKYDGSYQLHCYYPDLSHHQLFPELEHYPPYLSSWL